MTNNLDPNADHKQHPLSAVFDSMSDTEHAALTADIQKHGLINPITLYQNEVLDGWHRYQACAGTGIAPRYVEYEGDDPAAFVQSVNHHRRHSTASRRAMAVALCSEWRAHGNQMASNSHQNSQSAEDMARRAGVSLATIKDCKAIIRAGKSDEVTKHGKSIASVARPKKPKPAPAIEPEPDIEDGDNEAHGTPAELMHEIELEDARRERLIESLSASDRAKEILSLHETIKALNGRIHGMMVTESEIKKSCKYYQGVCDRFRKLLGVDRYSDLVRTLEERIKP